MSSSQKPSADKTRRKKKVDNYQEVQKPTPDSNKSRSFYGPLPNKKEDVALAAVVVQNVNDQNAQLNDVQDVAPDAVVVQNVNDQNAQMNDVQDVAPDAVVVQNINDQNAQLNDVLEMLSELEATFDVGAMAPYVHIIEQPAPKSHRFRYESEGRAGSILGVNSTKKNKTYPTIEISGYKGRMIILVSCVTREAPYKPHPHELIGSFCQDGVLTVKVKTKRNADTWKGQFNDLSIQAVLNRDIVDSLVKRENLLVDPFKTGYAHRTKPKSIDKTAVRLCFQVFLADKNNKTHKVLQPIVSEVIYDKKSKPDLRIIRSSHSSGPAEGGTKVVLFCGKVTIEDTEVLFFEEDRGAMVWSDRGIVGYVHKQLAIEFRTPPYCGPCLCEKVTVQFRLQRISDEEKSNAYDFEYHKDVKGPVVLGKQLQKKLPDLREYEYRSIGPAIKAKPNELTAPHHVAATAYGEQAQLPLEMPCSSYVQTCVPQNPRYVQTSSPHLRAPPVHAQQPSPNIVQQSLPHHVQLPSPHHMQQRSPDLQQRGIQMQAMQLPAATSHTTSPPTLPLRPGLLPQRDVPSLEPVLVGMDQQPTCSQRGIQMQAMQLPAASSHTTSPPTLPLQPGLLLQRDVPPLAPLLVEMGQQPTCSQRGIQMQAMQLPAATSHTTSPPMLPLRPGLLPQRNVPSLEPVLVGMDQQPTCSQRGIQMQAMQLPAASSHTTSPPTLPLQPGLLPQRDVPPLAPLLVGMGHQPTCSQQQGMQMQAMQMPAESSHATSPAASALGVQPLDLGLVSLDQMPSCMQNLQTDYVGTDSDEDVLHISEDVQCMSEDVQYMSEDMPYMSEDVLYMSEDVQYMSEDMQYSDMLEDVLHMSGDLSH